MKKACAVTGLLMDLVAGHSFADVGIGATVRSDVASLYIPWQLSPEFRLEGELSRLEDETDEDEVFFETVGVSPLPVFGSAANVANNDAEITEYGIGAFWTPEVRDNWLLLIGMRVNHAESASSISSPNFSIDRELSGIEWGPSFGMEYELLDDIHLALEYSYYIRDMDGESTTRSVGPLDTVTVRRTESEVETTGTRTRIVLRYFF